MTTYYKAVQTSGYDFYTGTVDWAGALTTGEVVRHPNPHRRNASGYLSVSTVPTDCRGMRWPCRLLAVEPVGRVWTPEREDLPHKRSAPGWRVIAELPATDALGPQGEHVAALIDRAGRLTLDEARRLYTSRGAAAWGAARDAATDAAWSAARGSASYAARYAATDAAWYAAWVAAWGAARDAATDAAGAVARALVVRDVLSAEYYDVLTASWRKVIGPIHPDDPR